MMIRTLSVAAFAVSMMLSAAPFAADASADIKAAVANPNRPAADSQRDADRKPADVVAFSGMKAGDKVGELAPGGGYFTRIFSKVVGPKGKVYATLNEAQVKAKPESANGMNTLAADTTYGNIVAHATNYEQLTYPEPLDVIWTSLNYHDFKNRGEGVTTSMNKAALAALKPGGTYIVIDHAAEKGSGVRDSNTLHRIDPDFVKQEVTAAGFIFEGESQVLSHAGDDHKAKVFEGPIRGKTDQFVFKFRKGPK